MTRVVDINVIKDLLEPDESICEFVLWFEWFDKGFV